MDLCERRARLLEALRQGNVQAACRVVDPFDGACRSVLYDEQLHTLLGRFKCGLSSQLVCDELGSWWPAPFILDDYTYASVWSFHQSLKAAEADRWALRNSDCRHRHVKPALRGSFTYSGRTIAVNSIDHCTLIVRATEAKVRSNPAVRKALMATERRWLWMGGDNVGALGRCMPQALMVLRYLFARR